MLDRTREPSRERPFAFVSTMEGDAWGGSEELWWSAALRLRKEGFRVRASLIGWEPVHPKVSALMAAGVDVQLRPQKYSVPRRGGRWLLRRRHSLTALDVEQWLRRDPPQLVIANQGCGLPPPDLTEVLRVNRWPYVTVTHVVTEFWWPDDDTAAKARAEAASSLWSYFVSNANRDLALEQYGIPASRTSVVRNPFNASHDELVSWPSLDSGEHLALACVGRLDPISKGQDILLRALATPAWGTRSWRLNIYGAGRMHDFIERRISELGLGDRVFLRGHRSIREIWAENHALVLPSRIEGLPIVIVEAMFCGRPVVTTDVAGNAELLEDGVDSFVAAAPTARHVGEALERLWIRRGELQAMGEAAARSARRQLPRDPAGEFVLALKRWAVQVDSEPSMPPGHHPQS